MTAQRANTHICLVVCTIYEQSILKLDLTTLINLERRKVSMQHPYFLQTKTKPGRPRVIPNPQRRVQVRDERKVSRTRRRRDKETIEL